MVNNKINKEELNKKMVKSPAKNQSKKTAEPEFTVAELKSRENAEQNMRLAIFAKKIAAQRERLKLEELRRYNKGELYI